MAEVEDELVNGNGIGLICTNRRPKNGRNPGGGVAILYKKSRVSLKHYSIARAVVR